MQRLVANLSDPVELGLLDLRRQRQHAPKHIADRCEIILRDPLPQLHEPFIQHRLRIQHLEHSLGLHGRGAIMQRRHHAGNTLIAKWNKHTPTHYWLVLGNLVGECHVQRDRQCYVAKSGHALREDCTGKSGVSTHCASARATLPMALAQAASILNTSSPSADLSTPLSSAADRAADMPDGTSPAAWNF